jgi:hypothetical protein
MRLWSLHPAYLDARGLVALWREALLAREVLRGNTRGYRHHPQLDRFRASTAPLSAINAYLAAVYAEAIRRGYAFDAGKLAAVRRPLRLTITRGQLRHEARHLERKLRVRDRAQLRRLTARRGRLRAHSLFRVVPGAVQAWERGVIESRDGHRHSAAGRERTERTVRRGSPRARRRDRRGSSRA